MQYNEINPIKHATYHFFYQALCAYLSLLYIFFSMPLAYSSTLCFHFFSFRPSALLFFFLFLGLWPHISFLSFQCGSRPSFISHIQHAFHKIQQYNTNINASICYSHLFTHWSRWQKRKVNGPKGLNQRVIFGWLSVWVMRVQK